MVESLQSALPNKQKLQTG